MRVSVKSCTDSVEPAAGRWVLIGATRGGEKDHEIPITGQRTLVGRRPDRDLVVSHPTVSGLHAEIVCLDEMLFISDLKSTNGTRVNERRIQSQTMISSGDRIRFGNVEMRIEVSQSIDSGATLMASSFEMTSRFLGFERLLNEPAIVPYFQPIITMKDGDLVAYEVLARSAVPGFENPGPMLATAEQMGLEHEFSDVCRIVGVQKSQFLAVNQQLFLNTHPEEIGKPELVESLRRLRKLDSKVALTLEIHESHVTNLGVMRALREELKDLNIQLAYDDFGVGQTRLLDLSEIPPDTLKFDMSLVQGLYRAGIKRQQMVATLVMMVRDFGITPLAEGIESREDMEICRKIGFQLAQGYFFGHPHPADHFDFSHGETVLSGGETMVDCDR